MDENMQPKRFPVSLIVIIVGVVITVIGVIFWKTAGIERYLDFENISIVNQPVDNITSFDFDINSGDVEIVTGGEKLEVIATNLPKGQYIYGTEDTTFRIKSKKIVNFFTPIDINWIAGDKYKTKITIKIPDTKVYDSFSFKLGVGESTVSGVHAKNIKLDTGAGEIKAADLTADGTLDVELGAGESSFSRCSAANVDFDCGAGETTYSGTITGKGKFDGGVGELDISVIGNYNDYDIDIDKGLGEVNVEKGDTSVAGDKKIPLKVDCGVGEVNVRFIGG